MNQTAARPVALMFPYLPLQQRLDCHEWELIPKGDLRTDDVAEDWMLEVVTGLLDLYTLRDSTDWVAVGCVARPAEQSVGDTQSPDVMLPLHRAVLTALLDTNPEVSEEDTEGQSIATSDNAVLYSYQLHQDGRLAVSTGSLVRNQSLGLRIGTDHSKILPPAEINVPFLHRGLDELYVSALWNELTKDSDDSRRLGRAIDWLDIAYRNTESIDLDTRLVSLRAGFEVLLEESGTLKLAKAVSDLLDPGDVERRGRRWTAPANGRPKEADFSDLGWWFVNFSLVRNKTMHGAALTPDEYLHDGKRHFWMAELQLRQAIKQTVANAGHPDVLVDPLMRVLRD